MPRGDGYGGRRAQAWVAGVLRTYGTTCHLCRHGGAESADHLVTRAEMVATGRLHLMFSVANGRPVHHRPCPSCGVRCNTRRKAKPMRHADPVDALGFFEGGGD